MNQIDDASIQIKHLENYIIHRAVSGEMNALNAPASEGHIFFWTHSHAHTIHSVSNEALTC